MKVGYSDGQVQNIELVTDEKSHTVGKSNVDQVVHQFKFTETEQLIGLKAKQDYKSGAITSMGVIQLDTTCSTDYGIIVPEVAQVVNDAQRTDDSNDELDAENEEKTFEETEEGEEAEEGLTKLHLSIIIGIALLIVMLFAYCCFCRSEEGRSKVMDALKTTSSIIFASEMEEGTPFDEMDEETLAKQATVQKPNGCHWQKEVENEEEFDKKVAKTNQDKGKGKQRKDSINDRIQATDDGQTPG